MKYFTSVAIALYFTLFSTGCTNFKRETYIDIPQNAPQKMVLQGEINADSPESDFLFLTRTNTVGQYIRFDFNVGNILERDTANPRNNVINFADGYSGYAADTVRGAQMSLYRNDTFLTQIKQSVLDPNGIFKTDKNLAAFTEGSVYKVKVTAPGFEPIEAEQKVPNFVPLIKASLKKASVTLDDGKKLSEILLEFNDPPNTEETYFTTIVLQDTAGNYFTWQKPDAEVFALDPVASTPLAINDRSFNGRKYTWRIGVSDIGVNDNKKNLGVWVYFRTVNKAYESYLRSITLINKLQTNPYIEPYTIYTNVKNGYGLFSISGKASVSFIKIN